MNRPDHYRLHDTLIADGVYVSVEIFKVIRETPQGYWVADEHYPKWCDEKELRKRKFARWVSKTSTKRYCYPTMEQAINSFKKRKFHYASRLKHKLEQTELILDNLDKITPESLMKEPVDCFDFWGVKIGKHPSINILDFL